MLELLLCATLTVLPDYLFRRFVQGKRLGREINLYTVWYELRWGITACLLLTISLITMIFYYHPSTKEVTAIFRTVSVLPESGGRVAEVFVDVNEKVKVGQLLFRLDSSQQEADLAAAKTRIIEIDAEIAVSKADVATAVAGVAEAQSDLQQALDDYNTFAALQKVKSSATSIRDVERRKVLVDSRQAALDAAKAKRAAAETKSTTLLPAQRASAEAARDQTQVALDKTAVRAGVAGTLQQFALRKGDVVNPLLRPAGILVPEDSGRQRLVAGFNQIESYVIRPGMIVEAICSARPFTIIPMVITEVQDVIAAGQLRPTDQLVDVQNQAQNGTITAFIEPLFEDQELDVPPGSGCIANAYTNNHDALEKLPPFSPEWLFLHVIDTVGLVHAMIIRMQAVMMPVQMLVLTGGH